MYAHSFFSLLFVLKTFPMIRAAYDSLLFTEDYFPLINSRSVPIVNPGKVSGHVHHVVGGSAFAATQDYTATRNSMCTSGNLPCDLSNYWAPQLYYKWRNGSYTAITGDGMTNYWKYPITGDNTEPGPFAAIPDNFRMLGGDVKRDDYDPHKAVSYLCIDAQNSYDYTDYMPTNRECLTLRPQLHFPECWNGVDSYKEDNSHVAYPVDAKPEGGQCPEGFQKIPHLFLESTYHINAQNIGEGYEWYPGCFVLSNGDNHGFSFHADWLNGFPSNFLTNAFTQCYDPATKEFIKDCDFIKTHRGDIGRDCVTEGDVINELVGQHSAIPSLPGNNPDYNSSKHSTNYPKGSIPDYNEQASIIRASDQSGGFCIQGSCTDYTGSDVVLQDPVTQVVPIPPTSAPTNNTGNTANPSVTNNVPQGSHSASATSTALPTSDTLRPTDDLGLDATMSILPIEVPIPVDSVSPLAAVQTTNIPNNGWTDRTYSRRSGIKRM